jgi:opacity protein-like surface antigen
MKKLLFALALLLCAAAAHAQTVVNPRTVEFTVSPDHAVVLGDGQPAVTKYDIRFYATGASAPFSEATLGKPTPDGTGKVALPLANIPQFVAIPVGTAYVARVVAVGPLGEGVSEPSNPFDIQVSPRAPAGVTIKK